MTPARAAPTVDIGDVEQRHGRAFRVLAIDPGPVESAYVVFDGERIIEHRKCDNTDVIGMCADNGVNSGDRIHALVVEEIRSYGMPVGREIFWTVFWSGRFVEAWGEGFDLICRQDVKLHHCKSARANDSTIRQALIDRFGGKESAIGRKKTPGPLYGIVADQWSALALAVTWWDQNVAQEHNSLASLDSPQLAIRNET